MRNSSTLKKLGYKIRLTRLEKKMTQEVLAYETTLAAPYIGQVERGKANISVNKLEMIANALDVEVKELFDFSLDSLI